MGNSRDLVLEGLECPCGADAYAWHVLPSPPSAGAAGVAACMACGLLRTAPPPYRDERAYPVYHRPPEPAMLTPAEEHLRLGLARRVLSAVPAERRRGALLDVGAGLGHLLCMAREMGWEQTLGVDLNRAEAEVARDRWGVEIRVGELADFELPASSQDTVVLNHVLEHVSHPAPLLAEIHRVLRPGGDLVVSVPNFASGMGWARGLDWMGLVPDQHVWQFTPGSLRSLLAGAGFQVQRVSARSNLHYPPDRRSPLHRLWWTLRWFPLIRGQAWLNRGDNLICRAQRQPFTP